MDNMLIVFFFLFRWLGIFNEYLGIIELLTEDNGDFMPELQFIESYLGLNVISVLSLAFLKVKSGRQLNYEYLRSPSYSLSWIKRAILIFLQTSIPFLVTKLSTNFLRA